jgi:hypothetical protein
MAQNLRSERLGNYRPRRHTKPLRFVTDFTNVLNPPIWASWKSVFIRQQNAGRASVSFGDDPNLFAELGEVHAENAASVL